MCGSGPIALEADQVSGVIDGGEHTAGQAAAYCHVIRHVSTANFINEHPSRSKNEADGSVATM